MDWASASACCRGVVNLSIRIAVVPRRFSVGAGNEGSDRRYQPPKTGSGTNFRRGRQPGRPSRKISTRPLARRARSAWPCARTVPHGDARRIARASPNVQKSAAADARDACARKAQARERIEIGLPTAARVARKARCRARIRGRERGAHVVADLVCGGADRGAEPSERPPDRRRARRPQRAARRRRDRASPHAQRRRGCRPRSQISTGKQSAVSTAQTTPGRPVTAPSGVRVRIVRSRSSTRRPCTCVSHAGSLGSPSDSRSRARFAATAAASSPTWSARLSVE